MKYNWKTDIEDWTELDKSAAALFISQAEKRLQETVNAANNISAYHSKLMPFVVMILSTALGYLFTEPSNATFALIAITACGFCGYSLLYLLLLIPSFELYGVGEDPKSVFISKMMDGQENQYLILAFQIMENAQNKIDKNLEIQGKRQIKLTHAKWSFALTPFSIVPGLCHLCYQYLS